nr:helicase-related protein [uncultured Brevundimonas sp.]
MSDADLAAVESDSSRWLRTSLTRTLLALRASTSVADRLVLIREACRLGGGRLDLASHSLVLSSEEEETLKRFGLAKASEGAVRLLTDDLDEIADGLSSALRLDAEPRKLFATAAADAALRRCMGHTAYTSVTQKAAIGALLTMPDAATLMVSMPTGSGKSLLFQLAPLWWRREVPGACVIVVVPTIALAEDHERTLQSIPGLEGSRALTGAMAPAHRDEVLQAFRRGETPVLLLSPEAAFGSARDALLNAAAPAEDKFGLAGRLMAVFVDEAHIIESWGRTFRPDFQRLPGLIDALADLNPALKTVLLSATLTPAARNVLRKTYVRGEWLEVDARIPRFDFDLAVRAFTDPAEREDVLLQAIDRLPRPALVYTTRVDQAEALHRRLRQRGFKRVEVFTGATQGPDRQRIIRGWASQKFDLVVATSAFGLGVDKGDVRAVVHACLPETPARWYQEIGRASRDGHQGLALTLFTRTRAEERRFSADEDNEDRPGRSDEELARRLAGAGWLSRPKAEARWTALVNSCKPEWTEDGHRKLILSLDSAREGLGRYTGEHNRGWNRSLLNLLQRAAVVELRADPPSEDKSGDGAVEPETWEVTLLDDRLVSPGEGWSDVWDLVFATRDAEKRQAIGELDRFRKLMSGVFEGCLLRETFALIEPGVDAADCGRCEDCRKAGRSPPTFVQPEGASHTWSRPEPPSSALGGGMLLVGHEGDLPRLIDRLARVGIEQIIASGERLQMIADALAKSPARFGFLHDLDDWLGPGRVIASVPTAVLADDRTDLAKILDRANALILDRPGQTLALVADPERQIDRRPLYHIASPQAPIHEQTLDDLALSTHRTT